MRILVVDDHRETRELITRNLAREAHMVQSAPSCVEALRALDAHSFDIVVGRSELFETRRVSLDKSTRRDRRSSTVAGTFAPRVHHQPRTSAGACQHEAGAGRCFGAHPSCIPLA